MGISRYAGIGKGWPVASGFVSAVAATPLAANGANQTLRKASALHVPYWVTMWDWLYKFTPDTATAAANQVAALGFTGVEINLLNGAITTPNVNGRTLLPTLNPGAPDAAFLADCVPLITPIMNAGLTVVLNLVWGEYINQTDPTAAKYFNPYNAAAYATAVSNWFKANWPNYNQVVISLIADSHPISKTTAGVTVAVTSVTRVDVVSGGAGYSPNDTLTFSTGTQAGVLEVVGGVIVGVRLTTGGTAASVPTVTVNTTTGSGASLVATRDKDFTATIDAMGTAVKASLPNALVTLHSTTPTTGANAAFDGNEIVNQSLGDAFASPPAWADLYLTQSGHARSRPRASAYENMARHERQRSVRRPYQDIESGYIEIPAGLPADVGTVGLPSNPLSTTSGSSFFNITYSAGHGLTTPTDGGKRHWAFLVGATTFVGLSFSGMNCEVTAVVDANTLTVKHPTQTASATTTGGGTTAVVRLRTEYLAADRLPTYHARQRAWQNLIFGAFGHTDSAEGVYNVYTGPGSNDKYLAQALYSDRLAGGVTDALYAIKLFRQRPLSKRVGQSLTAATTASFVRIYGTNATFHLNNITSGGRQNLAYNSVQGCVADDQSYAVVYSASGQEFDLNLADYLTQGSAYSVYWVNPRTGAIDTTGRVYIGGSYTTGVFQYTGGTEPAPGARLVTPTSDPTYQAVHFTPPTTDTAIALSGAVTTRIDDGKDWVLVIEKQGVYSALSL